MADQAVCVGPARSADSYMSINNIVQACLATGAQAVHPGNGFLAENAQFSAELSKHGIAFIGPKTHSISAMTDKLAAKKIAKEAKLNTVPGSSEPVRDAKHAVQVASDLGFPVILKSCVGGGGKGLAVAHDAKECEDAFKKCHTEP
jgi:propionyl-CoA carboxylase alpha chain